MSNLNDNRSKTSILIVDDIIANLSVLSSIIKKAGYTARSVTSVKQAMQAVQKDPPQLILLDIAMPDMDGFEWCTILKNNLITRDIPIIFISGMNSKEDRVRGLSLGAVDFISKPFEVEEVTLRINTHLKLYEMQKKLEGYNKKLQKLVSDQVDQLTKERKEMILLMAKLAEFRRPMDSKQIENIAENSRLLATCLLLTSQEETVVTNQFIDDLELAALMYDIGVITLEDSIYSKLGHWSMEEEKQFQSHTERGATLIRELSEIKPEYTFLAMAVQIARSHHECFDGSGYPDGRKGDEIPLAARIVTIADEFAIRMRQMLKKEDRIDLKTDKQIVVEGMMKESGTRFDPKLIELWNRIQNLLKY